MEKVVSLLQELKHSLSCCESLTGGLFSKRLTDTPGVSVIFKGSIVAYTSEAKEKIVGVKREILNKYGTVSKECALAMAQNVRELFKSDVAISFTGNAGPDAIEGKPVGLVYLAIVSKSFFVLEELQLQGTRAEIREAVVQQGQMILAKTLERIKKESPK